MSKRKTSFLRWLFGRNFSKFLFWKLKLVLNSVHIFSTIWNSQKYKKYCRYLIIFSLRLKVLVNVKFYIPKSRAFPQMVRFSIVHQHSPCMSLKLGNLDEPFLACVRLEISPKVALCQKKKNKWNFPNQKRYFSTFKVLL